MERGRVRPATNRKQNLQMPVMLLQVVNGLEIAVQVLALVVPRVTRIVDLLIGPCVG